LDIFIILVIVCIAVAAVAFVLSKIGRRLSRRSFLPPRGASSKSRYEEEDRAFEASLSKHVGRHAARHFFTKVVGITHRNEDGTVRETLLRHCKQFDFLHLVPELKEPHDPYPISVRLKDGRCLGFLNSRTAEEIRLDMQHGAVWLACVKFRKLPRKPRNGCLVLCMMKMTDEWVAVRARKKTGPPNVPLSQRQTAKLNKLGIKKGRGSRNTWNRPDAAPGNDRL
jgi:hypothetical protein